MTDETKPDAFEPTPGEERNDAPRPPRERYRRDEPRGFDSGPMDGLDDDLPEDTRPRPEPPVRIVNQDELEDLPPETLQKKVEIGRAHV
jgi:hypothetical protein